MADPKEEKPKTQTVSVGGVPYKLNEDQLPGALESGAATPITPEDAEKYQQDMADQAYLRENWGEGGIAGLGALSGATAGLGPAALASMGLVDPRHVLAAQSHLGYKVGDVAGMVIPALLSGGESALAEGAAMTPAGAIARLGGAARSGTDALLERVIGKAPGLMGRMATLPISLAAQGATEGALISLGHQIGDNMIQNRPLAAESLAALGDGALWGGITGAGLGTVGAVGHAAVDAASRAMGRAAEGKSGLGIVGRHLGMSGEEMAAEGSNLPNKFKSFNEILKKGGSEVGDTLDNQVAAASKASKVSKTAIKEAIQDLEEQAPDASMIQKRLPDRIQRTILDPLKGTLEFESASKEVGKFLKKFESLGDKEIVHTPAAGKWPNVEGSEPVENHTLSWKKLIQSRDQLSSASSPIGKQILNAVDDEIRAGMEEAERFNPNLKGTAAKYAAAQTDELMSEELKGLLSRRKSGTFSGGGTSITPHNVAMGGVVTLSGHPGAAATYIAGKMLAPRIMSRIEPAMVKYAYNRAVGQAAEGAAQQVRGHISKSLDKFFKPGSVERAVYTVKSEDTKGGKNWDRAAYEDLANKAEAWTSGHHQEMLRLYASRIAEAGYPDLAGAIQDSYQRAYEFTLGQMLPRKGAKVMTSLRKQPVSQQLDMSEFKFMRTIRPIIQKGGPLSVLDRALSGQSSVDEIRSLKYTSPAIHDEFVQQATERIYDMKQAGEHLPMDKVAYLGIALDAPIDSTLTSDYIGAVQSVYANPPTLQGQPPAGPGAGQAVPHPQRPQLNSLGQNLATPSQTVMSKPV